MKTEMRKCLMICPKMTKSYLNRPMAVLCTIRSLKSRLVWQNPLYHKINL
ncbi:Protein of unknown function [Pyronema omphalodes CBS 100304]|uniref:Uncharacterized protein n=1 Tax=Pyronema omphalodes (strain CBS 100304) TaxID=1076935 RepID=U4LDA7_PYROM|nr:Protein of unknown function [Pyronema omphalodes CBS 100304]